MLFAGKDLLILPRVQVSSGDRIRKTITCVLSRHIPAQNPLVGCCHAPVLCALASGFFLTTRPSPPHPSLTLLPSGRPQSSSNPLERVFASGLLHLLFPLVGMPFPREPALPHVIGPSCSHTPLPPQHSLFLSSDSAHFSS